MATLDGEWIMCGGFNHPGRILAPGLRRGDGRT